MCRALQEFELKRYLGALSELLCRALCGLFASSHQRALAEEFSGSSSCRALASSFCRARWELVSPGRSLQGALWERLASELFAGGSSAKLCRHSLYSAVLFLGALGFLQNEDLKLSFLQGSSEFFLWSLLGAMSTKPSGSSPDELFGSSLCRALRRPFPTSIVSSFCRALRKLSTKILREFLLQNL